MPETRKIVGTFQLDQCRIVLHGLENAGDEEDNQREERRTHPGHDDALCDDFRALPGFARTEVLRSERVGVGKKADEKTERKIRRHAATERRCHVRGINLRHEVPVGEDHHGEGALRHHHREGEPQQLGHGVATKMTVE